MKRQAPRLIIFLLSAIFLSFSTHTTFGQKGENLIKIAVTTDVHGAYFPQDWYTGKSIPGSLSQVSTWAREQRAIPGQTIILLDNGDLIQGDPASYYSNFVDRTKPNIAARILNFMDYEAGTVGNHDLEAGHPVYDKLVKEFQFPWLSANSIKAGTDEPWFKPYTILTHSGIRIAVLGLTTPKIPDWLPPALWSGMEFHDMIETARKWTEFIRTHEKPDLMIGLFHAGVDATYGQQQATRPLNENASSLVAQKVTGFDIVFTGHDHRNWNFRVADPNGDSVLILGSESRAGEIAVATIVLSRKGKSTGILSISGTHQEMKPYSPDPLFIIKFKGYIDSVQQYVDQPVGTITKAIASDEAYFGPTEFVDLIHRAQLELTGADISFTAPLSFRATIPQGPITVKDLFKLYRFENQLYTISLTGSEILGYLNYSYSLWMKTMTGPDDPLLNMEQQADGTWRLKSAYYNFDSASGIDYTVDLTKPVDQMVNISRMTDGRPFDLTRTYKVALNSYRGSGGGSHLSKGAGLSKEEVAKRLISASDMDFRFLLTGWLRKQGTIDPVTARNWKTIPENWTQAAAKRDALRLFPAR
ncbi:MAG: bifunctional UDP-sugar hydrolase/5'-nucleotidase [Bacteroidales bacterium]|jgi:2',3'-cyclic-nucleotide 2'-phosphodiesterase/3'-nucleotidase